MPEAERCHAAIADTVDILAGIFTDTRLEDDTEDLLWGFANLFHRQIDRIDRQLDRNELEQRRLQREQDGSEVAASSSSARLHRAPHSWSGATPSNSCAKPPPSTSVPAPDRPGARATVPTPQAGSTPRR